MLDFLEKPTPNFPTGFINSTDKSLQNLSNNQAAVKVIINQLNKKNQKEFNQRMEFEKNNPSSIPKLRQFEKKQGLNLFGKPKPNKYSISKSVDSGNNINSLYIEKSTNPFTRIFGKSKKNVGGSNKNKNKNKFTRKNKNLLEKRCFKFKSLNNQTLLKLYDKNLRGVIKIIEKNNLTIKNNNKIETIINNINETKKELYNISSKNKGATYEKMWQILIIDLLKLIEIITNV
jgi:hypothetical protein